MPRVAFDPASWPTGIKLSGLIPSTIYHLSQPDTCRLDSLYPTTMSPLQLLLATRDHQIFEFIGPAIPQALQLARYQALKCTGKDIVEVDENDVISQKPSREEERIMASNALVVSALEDIFSWMSVSVSSFVNTVDSHLDRNKDRTSKTSKLSFVESLRFRRAMYRIWIMSTLYGYGSARHGERVQGTSGETQMAFLSKFTSQELVHISKVGRFLRFLGNWVILAEYKLVGSLDVCQSMKAIALVFCRTDQATFPFQQTILTDCFCGLALTSFYAASRSKVLVCCR